MKYFKMNRRISILFFFASLLPLQPIMAQDNWDTQGYKNGTLIVIGGGKVGDEIMNEFYNLAGGT